MESGRIHEASELEHKHSCSRFPIQMERNHFQHEGSECGVLLCQDTVPTVLLLLWEAAD